MDAVNTNALRGLVFTSFKSQAEFARSIDWHPNKVSALLSGAYTPNVDEAALLYDRLNMTIKQYAAIFLPNISPNGDGSKEQTA